MKSNKSSSTKYFTEEINIEFKKYKIIGFKAIIETGNMSVKCMKALNNFDFIIAAIDNKLLLYNNISYNQIKEIQYNNFQNYSFYELDNKSIIIYSNHIIITQTSLTNNTNEICKIVDEINIKNIIQTNSKNFIVCSNNGIFIIGNLMSSVVQLTINEIYKKLCIGAININNYFSAFTSNRVLSNGEDKIIFFRNTAIYREIKGYSFLLSKNNLYLIYIPDKYNKTKNNKLLFCACKKYIKSQKNGILLLKLNIKNNYINDIYKTFYKTGNFEVYCFCNISKNNNINIFGNKKKENENNYTEYIFVGGYDNYKMKGLIKLYEIIYNEDIEKIKLEYIQDIQIDKIIKKESSQAFKGCKSPICFIEQSRINEDILISTFDKNIYLFSKPYLEIIKKVKNLDFLNF